MTWVLIVIISITVASIANSWINNRRQIAINNINHLYDEIELYVIKNNIRLDSRMMSLMRWMKIFKLNPSFADIHILLVTLQNTPQIEFEKNKIIYDQIIKELPDGLLRLKHKFDTSVGLATVLSIFRLEFMLFFLYSLSKHLLKSVLEKSSKRILSFFGMIRDLMRYEEVVISKYSEYGEFRLAA